MMGAIELTPDKAARASFEARGTVGMLCRSHCAANGLVMRAVGDTMIISPPLVISRDEIDQLGEMVWKVLDLTHASVKADGLR